MKRNCSIYFRDDGVYVLSTNLTTPLIWIINGYGVTLSSSTAEELTAAIEDSLAHSTVGVPMPETPIGVPECVRAKGIKSWRAFEKGARPFGVRVVDESLVLTINKPYKSGGFVVDREDTYAANEIKNVGARLLELANV